MSGGSFSYLCYKEVEDILYSDALDQMVTALSDYGAEDAAKETEEIALILRNARIRAEARMNRLRPVWKALEWWHSGDTSEEGFQKALKAYREGNE